LSKIKETDKAVFEIFKGITVVGDDCKSHEVPAVWGEREKLINCIHREDEVVDIIRLPLIGVESTDIYMRDSESLLYYKVNVFTLYSEDMNQIIEQIVLKFDNTKNCKLHSIHRMKKASKKINKGLKLLRCEISLSVEGLGVPVETHG
jgi:hypothetical protein